MINSVTWTTQNIEAPDAGALEWTDSPDSVGNAKDFAGTLQYNDGSMTITRDQETAAPTAGTEFDHPETGEKCVIGVVTRNFSANTPAAFDITFRQKNYTVGS